MSSNPPCSHSRLHLYHPTLDIRAQDHTVEVSGTFKGFHVHARYVLDWHGMCPVEWSVRDKHGRACVEVGDFLEDLKIELGSLLLARD